MSLIKWNETFSVHIEEIDKEHKQLVMMVNDLTDAMKTGKGRDVLGEILEGLIAYTASHFRTEEKYFKQFHYPHAVEHKKEHADFVKNVLEFKEQFDQGKSTVSVNVLQFLSKWLQAHIKEADMKYSTFLNDRGVK